MISHIKTLTCNQIKKSNTHLKNAAWTKKEKINLKGGLERCNYMHQKFSNKFKIKKKTHNQFQDKVILKIVERSNLMIIISMKKINSTLKDYLKLILFSQAERKLLLIFKAIKKAYLIVALIKNYRNLKQKLKIINKEKIQILIKVKKVNKKILRLICFQIYWIMILKMYSKMKKKNKIKNNKKRKSNFLNKKKVPKSDFAEEDFKPLFDDKYTDLKILNENIK
jgi:hypothetical protein